MGFGKRRYPDSGFVGEVRLGGTSATGGLGDRVRSEGGGTRGTLGTLTSTVPVAHAGPSADDPRPSGNDIFSSGNDISSTLNITHGNNQKSNGTRTFLSVAS